MKCGLWHWQMGDVAHVKCSSVNLRRGGGRHARGGTAAAGVIVDW